ncbi:hypothetical protein [Methylobacillus sp.]|uniref:hypothetical protein n=1 Tax=Methylobacillus sp. TaxID=56818 RepID=UPI0012D0C2EB|nr:hypothetical protein [Methylobacillus sp.]MPS48944.1 hypothetical protein [Methylobacillus sp.]
MHSILASFCHLGIEVPCGTLLQITFFNNPQQKHIKSIKNIFWLYKCNPRAKFSRKIIFYLNSLNWEIFALLLTAKLFAWQQKSAPSVAMETDIADENETVPMNQRRHTACN